MRKIIFVLLSLILTNIQTFADRNKIDSVLLTNGNLLIGRVSKFLPNEYLKIRTNSGNFFCAKADIQSIRIHSVENYQLGFDVTDKINSEIKESTDSNTVFKKETNNKIKIKIPTNLLLAEAGIDGSDIQYKFQATFFHRTSDVMALGFGYTFRNFNYTLYDNIFFDLRSIHQTVSHNFLSFAIDLGYGIERQYGVSSGGSFVATPSWTFGLKLDQYLYLTFGIDLNYQTNVRMYYGFDNITNIGAKVGIML